MEQLSGLWRHIINLIFPFSSCKNSVSLISHTLPSATLSCMHSSANLLWSNPSFFFLRHSFLYWIEDLRSDKSCDIMLTVLHILIISGFTDELANFINIFITSAGIAFIKYTERKTLPFMLVPVLGQGPSGKAHLAFIMASFNQTILWSI